MTLKPPPLLMLLSLLTACASSSRRSAVSSLLYSPPVLELRAGVPVATAQGTYVPQTDEVWHSHAAYLRLVVDGLNPAPKLNPKPVP